MLQPVLETESFAEQAGRAVGSHQGGFDQEGAGSTGGVDEAESPTRGFGPTGEVQNRSSEVLFERCPAGTLPVAPTMLTFARKVECELVRALTDVEVKPDVRGLLVDARTPAGMVPKGIYNRVLGPLDPIVGGDRASRGFRAPNRECPLRVEVLPPRKAPEGLIQNRVVLALERNEG
jgi:hypothetical protein